MVPEHGHTHDFSLSRSVDPLSGPCRGAGRGCARAAHPTLGRTASDQAGGAPVHGRARGRSRRDRAPRAGRRGRVLRAALARLHGGTRAAPVRRVHERRARRVGRPWKARRDHHDARRGARRVPDRPPRRGSVEPRLPRRQRCGHLRLCRDRRAHLHHLERSVRPWAADRVVRPHGDASRTHRDARVDLRDARAPRAAAAAGRRRGRWLAAMQAGSHRV